MTTDEYRKFKDRSVRRWLAAIIVAGIGCNLLLLGPCNVGTWVYGDRIADLKMQLESQLPSKYGDSVNWDGEVPCHAGHNYRNSFGQCFH